MPSCRHTDQLSDAPREPLAEGCEECLKANGTWVHLRVCQSCGHVGCCDQSAGRHATAHFHETRHPVIRSNEGREEWAWCYVDRVEYDPAEDWDREGADLG
jgi:uncharacterized UBP type Zn finger protein